MTRRCSAILALHAALAACAAAAPAPATAAPAPDVPIVIMSDRYLGTSVVLRSTCAAAADPSALAFHLITSREGKAVLPALFGDIAPCRGARLTATTVEEATAQLAELGFHPFWDDSAWDAAARATPEAEWGVRTPYRDAKHADALNHLRFYLPHLPMLRGAERFVFMDDDIVVQRDVADFAALDLAPGKAMAAGCQHWEWSPAGFVTSYDMSMVRTGYMGAVDTPCKEGAEGAEQKSCTRPTLMAELRDVDDEVRGAAAASSSLRGAAPHPLERTAFNMGFNVIDVASWKAQGLSENYELWVAASADRKLFPPDTLAFGLVIAYLALGSSVQCYDAQVTHLVGLAFIPQSRLEGEYGWTPQRMRDEAFALHFNGAHKPWDAPTPECRGADEEQFAAAADIWRHHCGDFCPCKPKRGGEPRVTVVRGRAPGRRLLSVEGDGDGGGEEQAAAPNEYVPNAPDACGEGCQSCDGEGVCTACEAGYTMTTTAAAEGGAQSKQCVALATSPASALRAGSGVALTALLGLCMAVA